MAEINLKFDLTFSRRFITIIGAAAVVLCAVPELESESLTLTTYYPAPSGVYTKMITTADTYLARDGGGLSVGTASPAAPLAKMVVMGGNVGIGTLNPGTAKLYVAAANFEGIRVASAVDPNLGIGLIKGNGDGATTATYNGALESWYGIAFRSKLDNTVRHTFDTRTGAAYFAGNLGVGVVAAATNRLEVSGTAKVTGHVIVGTTAAATCAPGEKVPNGVVCPAGQYATTTSGVYTKYMTASLYNMSGDPNAPTFRVAVICCPFPPGGAQF